MNPVLAIAYRDVVKFVRDRPRIVSSLIFPVLFIGVLGGSAQSNLGRSLPYDLQIFAFVGVLAQTMFQSSSLGIVSLLQDRENDFTQEIFVAPVSRYAIILGKIIGESAVSLVQGVAIVTFGVVVGVPLTLGTLLSMAPVLVLACLLGGAFGVAVMSTLRTQRSANELFPFVMLPQFFLAGVLVPVKVLPLYLEVLSRISPMRYVVDLLRDVYYRGRPEYSQVVLEPAGVNLVVVVVLFALFMVVGTHRFVARERNR